MSEHTKPRTESDVMTDYRKERVLHLYLLCFHVSSSLSSFAIELLPRLNLNNFVAQMAEVSGMEETAKDTMLEDPVLSLALPLICWQVNSQPDSRVLASEKCVFHGRGLEIEMAKSQSVCYI